MLKFKLKFLIITPSIFIFFWLLFLLSNIIQLTLSFNPQKNYKSNQNAFSYVINYSNNKSLSKLSKKFNVFDEKEEVPYLIKNAFISSEDKRFLNHSGIDLIGLSRAFFINFKNRSIKEGGSTITQQVSRLIFLNNDLNITRKIKELIISIILDFKYSKNQILKIYINNIYLGEGAYGINNAAEIYFNKLIHELTLSEIALLVGLAPAPSIYSPFENYDLAIKNRNKVLQSMYLEGYISKEIFNQALIEKIKLNKNIIESYNSQNKLLIKFILKEAKGKLKLKNDFKIEETLIIKSSIKNSWQKEAENISKLLTPNDIEIALITIDSNNGLIRSFVSGRNKNTNEFNRVINAIRPLGSTFKIIPYIAALIDGKDLNYNYIDLPTCWEDYCPKNFSNKYYGKISLIDSFKVSSNIVPIKITKEIGLKNIIDLANSFGLGYEQKYDEFLPLAIGAYGDNLINITSAYSTINNQGMFIEPEIVEEIKLNRGEIIWENNINSKRIIDDVIAKKMQIILEKSVSEGNGIAASVNGKKIYGKTGTSDKNRDLWFIGSINNFTTGVWLGFDDNRESNLSSGNAAFLWKKYIKNIKQIK